MEESIANTLLHYYEKQEIAIRDCLFALKSIILSVDKHIVHKRKYQIPFFSYKEFSLGLLWVYKKKIFVGFVEDKKTLSEGSYNPKKDSVLTMKIDSLADLPIGIIKQNIVQLITKYNLSS